MALSGSKKTTVPDCSFLIMLTSSAIMLIVLLKSGWYLNGDRMYRMKVREGSTVKAIRRREDLKVGYWSMNAALQDERRFGREEGRKEGLFEGRLYTLYGLVMDGVLTKEDAAARLGMTPEEFDEAVKAINTEGTTQ